MLKRVMVLAFMTLAAALVVAPVEAGVGGCGPRGGVGGCGPGGWMATVYIAPETRETPSFLDRLDTVLPLQVRILLRGLLNPTTSPATQPVVIEQPGTTTIEGVGGCGPRRGVGGCKF